MRGVWNVAGFVLVGLALVGAFLPALPTTPLVILAAACFSRGSRRWQVWLRRQRLFGPLLRDWEKHRAISVRARIVAILSIILVGTASAFMLPSGVARVALVAILGCAAIFIATRPVPPLPEPVRVPASSPR